MIDPRFDAGTLIEPPHFREGWAPVTLDGNGTYVDSRGGTAFVGEAAQVWNFVDGRALIHRSESSYSVIDRHWREVSAISLAEIPYFFDFPEDWNCFPCLEYHREHGYRRAFIDWRGEFIFPPIYAEVGPFVNGVAPFSPQEQFGPWGLVHISGKVILEPMFHSIGPFCAEGLAPAAREKKKFGFINTKGEWVIPPVYRQALPFHEGLACVTIAGKTRHGNKGFINLDGEMVISPRFFRQSRFHGGWALVEFEGMDQVIDRSGRVLWETSVQQ